MKNKTSLIITLSSLLACALFAAPAKINYQGLITNTAGEPIESSTNTVTATLYQVETDGASAYTESFTDVASDADGIYSIQIGDTNLQAVLEANSELWLELIINGQTLSPRQEINSVPYALVADSANRLISASDSSISGDLSVSGNSTFSGISVTGPASLDSLDVMGPAMFYDINVNGGFSAYNSEAGMYSYIGRDPSTGSVGNRLVGTTIIDNLSVSGGSATFDGTLKSMGILDVTGPAYFSDINISNDLNVGGFVTATEFITTSDYRFKDNIKTITGAVDKVKQLRGVEYTLKSNGKDSVGVIAQEVEKVYPQLVSTSDELEGITDAKAVNYSSLIGVLIEAIKEQQTQIEDLKAQVNVLNESTNNQATNTILATFDTQQ